MTSTKEEIKVEDINTSKNNNEPSSDDKAPLKYIFQAVDDTVNSTHYSHIFTKENFKTLEKWGLIKNMELVKFRFNTSFELQDLQRFLKDLFNDPCVRKNFPILTSVILPDNQKKKEKFKYKVLNTRATNMDLFDAMYENDLVTLDTGYIHQDYDTYVEDITVSDKLKQALLVEDSEPYSVFSQDQRDEFLFHIFKRIVIGGSLCQYENTVEPYLEMTKDFYKDIVSAAKEPETNKIYIRSVPVEILSIEKSNLYKIKNHPQNFFYVVIDPYQRYVHLWYHNWVPFW